MTSFGARLRAERQRLGLTQAEMAVLGDVSTNSQNSYERDVVSPPEKYLSHLVARGVDINFLFTGEYATAGASRQIAELLAMLNHLPPNQQAMAFAILSLYQEATASGAAETTQADEIWRAVRLFRKFLKLSPQGKAYLEKAAEIED